MANINHAQPAHDLPVEGDGISYRGIGWFIVILTVTTIFCQGLVWGMFKLMESRVERADAARSPVAAPAVTPTIQDGRVVSGNTSNQPGLLVVEATILSEFRRKEDTILKTYAIDVMSGVVRIPIERAKALVLERGFPARAGATSAAPAPPAAATAAPATTASPHAGAH